MTLEELCCGLLDALEAFDTEILPLGLYASDEIKDERGRAPGKGQHQEWPRAILPRLQSWGVRATQRNPQSMDWQDRVWSVDGLGLVHIDLSRSARIKVRRYGSGYQVDKHEVRDHFSGDFES